MQYSDIFEKLSKVDVNDRLQTKKSGSKEFSYLPWADCEQFAYNTIDPDLIQVDQFETPQGLVILSTPGDGFMVKVTVTIAGVARGDWYPVIDYDNRVIKSPNAFDINTALQRAKVKAFAQHGLGLYVFLGKDGPQEHNPNDATSVPDVPPAKPATPPAKPQVKAPVPASKPTPKPAEEPAKQEETPPWNEGRDWSLSPFDEEYQVDFVAHLDSLDTVEKVMEFVQKVVSQLKGSDKNEFRTAVNNIIMARAKAING